MKTKGQFISLLLVICLVFGLMPMYATSVFAEGTDKVIMVGASQIAGAQADNVYFGTYEQDSTTGADPIKWRVLSNSGGKLFLLADQNLDVSPYHTEFESVTWETSTIRSWLNGYGASSNIGGDSGIDYSRDNFLDTAFGAKEQDAIFTTTVVNADNPYFFTEGGNDTQDKVFLLSIDEVKNTAYGFEDSDSLTDTRVSTNTAYVAAGGKLGIPLTYSVGEADYWWLRSTGQYVGFNAYVYTDGQLLDMGDFVSNNHYTVRPAFNLNLDSVLFSSAVTGGKSSGTVGANALKSVSEYTSDTAKEWKVTLLDTDRTFTAKAAEGAKTNMAVGYSNWSVDVTYSNAKTDTNEYVSAMLCDADDNVLYYGNIANGSASGTQVLNIPAGLAIGNYKLKVFSEQLNGDKKTDYASEFKEIPLTVTYPKVATPTARFTATSHNSGTLAEITTDMMYSIDGGKTWEAVTSTTMNISGITAENGIKVYAKGDEVTTSDSDIQTITITKGEKPTGIAKTDCTTTSNNDGIISGVDNTMEYKIADSQDEWTPITATSITGLSKGTYEVRIKANGTTLASDAVAITIGEYVAPKVTEPTDTDKEGSNTSKKSEKKESPQTGDTENMYLWLALIMISAGGTLTIVSKKKH